MAAENKESAVPLMEDTFADQSDMSDPNASNGNIGSSHVKVEQPKRGIGLFVANLCVLLLINMVLITYNISIVRTIEKRFGLTSTQTGLTWSMSDIVHTCLVSFVAYFAQTSHKPRVLSVTMSFSAVGACIMTFPYFMFPRQGDSGSIVNITNSSSAEFCSINKTGHIDQCDGRTEGQTQIGAWYIFLFGQLLNGVGGTGLQTLGLAYIDENASKSQSSLLVGIVTSMYAFGPIIGFMVSAISLQFPETPWQDPEGSPSDSMWIGCWWLGFALCSCFTIIAVIPMWFFPRSISRSVTNSGRTRSKETENDSALHQLKALPKSLLSLLSNKAYMTLLFMIVCMAYIIQGVFSQIVRYIEIHFLVPAFTASIIAAVVAAGAGAVGGFMGGLFMNWMKLSPRGASWMVTLSMGACAAGIGAAMFMSCPQISMAGTMQSDGLHAATQCSKQCSCSEGTNYSPVCGSDGITYFSPCHAGCSSFDNYTYSHCSCLSDSTNSSTATPGHCPVSCNLLIPYTIVIFLMCFLGTVARVPGTILQFRIVKPEEKAFALGLISFAMNIFALIPGPILFGSLIDNSCILWQKPCSGNTGVCLLFDTAKFRLRTYGVTLGFEVLAFLLSFLLVYFVHQIEFPEDTGPLDDVALEVTENGDSKKTRDERV